MQSCDVNPFGTLSPQHTTLGTHTHTGAGRFCLLLSDICAMMSFILFYYSFIEGHLGCLELGLLQLKLLQTFSLLAFIGMLVFVSFG